MSCSRLTGANYGISRLGRLGMRRVLPPTTIDWQEWVCDCGVDAAAAAGGGREGARVQVCTQGWKSMEQRVRSSGKGKVEREVG